MIGSEEITIAGVKIQAVIDETTSSNALGIGATNNERTMVVKFPPASYTGTLKSGKAVIARGQTWQIAGDPDSIRKGQAAITLTLIEPERRD